MTVATNTTISRDAERILRVISGEEKAFRELVDEYGALVYNFIRRMTQNPEMADDLTQLPAAVRLARFARSLIRQNVALSFGLKAVFLLLALMGVIAKRPLANIAWGNGDRPPRDGYGYPYWQRLQKLKYDFLRGDLLKVLHRIVYGLFRRAKRAQAACDRFYGRLAARNDQKLMSGL